jgi:hypothetical protein
MDRLAAIADKAECTEVVHRVARAIDRRDPELLATLFHPDATDDHGMFAGTAADFIAWVMPVLGTMKRTQHLIGQVLVEVSGEQARAESYFIAHHTIAGPDGDVLMLAAGRYLDRFERRDGVWKIAHRLAVYDWNDTRASTDSFDRSDPNGWTYGVAGPADASYAHFGPSGLLSEQ